MARALRRSVRLGIRVRGLHEGEVFGRLIDADDGRISVELDAEAGRGVDLRNQQRVGGGEALAVSEVAALHEAFFAVRRGELVPRREAAGDPVTEPVEALLFVVTDFV